ncbi:hypothetical protein ABKV19_009665 [Rosa sericea]
MKRGLCIDGIYLLLADQVQDVLHEPHYITWSKIRLWDMATKSCLKMFAHNDYVTCIQFNPLDDSVFLSGSLDAKFRLWDIPDRRMVDWTDLHEMVTAACYTPEGQLTVDFGGRILSVSIDVPGKDTYHIQPR